MDGATAEEGGAMAARHLAPIAVGGVVVVAAMACVLPAVLSHVRLVVAAMRVCGRRLARGARRRAAGRSPGCVPSRVWSGATSPALPSSGATRRAWMRAVEEEEGGEEEEEEEEEGPPALTGRGRRPHDD
jgi:hypothetical protein